LGLKKFLRKVAFQSGIANCTEYLELIQLVIDNESTRAQEVYLNRHLKICSKCLEELNLDKEVKKAIRLKLEYKQVPLDLVASIKTKIAQSA